MRWWILTPLIGIGLFGAARVAVQQTSPERLPEKGEQVRVQKPVLTERASESDRRIPDQHGVTESGESDDSAALSDFELLLRSVKESGEALEEVPAYRAHLDQQVRIDGKLREPESIEIKIRHQPFSVYMKWDLDGQEVLYVDGKNDGCLLARPTRGIFALRGLWKLPPESRQAMKDCRYPITELGIRRLQERIEEFHHERGYSPEGLETRHALEQIAGRPCLRFDTMFESSEEGGKYSRSIVTIDAETMFTVGVENYGWTKEGEPGGLLETYFYRDVQVITDPSDSDFDEKNPEYKFYARK